MRLKESDDTPLGVAAARSVERGANLCRMMRVVVDHQRTVVVAEDLKAPIDAEELRHSGSGGFRSNTELARDGDRGQGVADVVLARHEEFEKADALDFERRA